MSFEKGNYTARSVSTEGSLQQELNMLKGTHHIFQVISHNGRFVIIAVKM